MSFESSTLWPIIFIKKTPQHSTQLPSWQFKLHDVTHREHPQSFHPCQHMAKKMPFLILCHPFWLSGSMKGIWITPYKHNENLMTPHTFCSSPLIIFALFQVDISCWGWRLCSQQSLWSHTHNMQTSWLFFIDRLKVSSPWVVLPRSGIKSPDLFERLHLYHELGIFLDILTKTPPINLFIAPNFLANG